MYAVIESGGKQYRVAVGDRLKVESLKLDPGSKLDLDKVLFLADGDDIKVGDPYVGGKVQATVVGHGRGAKIRVFKLRRRKNSRQRAGHRQNFTELEIVSIDGKSAKAAAKPAKETTAKKPPVKDVQEKAAETAAEAPAPEAKPEKVAAKKATTKKTTAKKATVKKTAAKKATTKKAPAKKATKKTKSTAAKSKTTKKATKKS